MTVSRSTMHIASPVTTSSITLLNFVSLWVMRSGICPLAMASRITPVIAWRCRANSNSARAPAARQIHQQALKFAEGLARLERLRGRLHRFVRLHALDIHKRPPDIMVAVLMARLAVTRRNHNQRASGDIGNTVGFQFFPDRSEERRVGK